MHVLLKGPETVPEDGTVSEAVTLMFGKHRSAQAITSDKNALGNAKCFISLPFFYKVVQPH
jgi:CBS domain-containing protein